MVNRNSVHHFFFLSYISIPYFFNLLYRLLRSMPNNFAALDLLPFASISVLMIFSFSISAVTSLRELVFNNCLVSSFFFYILDNKKSKCSNCNEPFPAAMQARSMTCFNSLTFPVHEY